MDNKISKRNRTPKEVKQQFIENCLAVGFDFGGIIIDPSIRGVTEFNLICADEHMNGYEIKGRASQFCLYPIKNGRSQKGVWYNYDQAHFDLEKEESFWIE